MQPIEDAEVSVDQIEAETGVSRNTIYSWVRRGKLPDGVQRPDPPRADGYVTARKWWPRAVLEHVRALAATSRNRSAREEVVTIAQIDDEDIRAAVQGACMGDGEGRGDEVSRLTHGILRHLHLSGWTAARLEPTARLLLEGNLARRALDAYARGFSALRDRPYLLVSPEGDVSISTALELARWPLPATVFRVEDLAKVTVVSGKPAER